MKDKILIPVVIFFAIIQTAVSAADKSAGFQTIDFGTREKRHFGGFHIDLPLTWTPSETENSGERNRILSYTAANKEQSIELSITYSADGSMDRVNRESDIYRKDIVRDKTRLHFLRSDGYEDATHNARFFYHLFEESKQSGFTVTGVLSSKTGDKLAVIKLVVSFPKGSPLTGDATEYLKKSTDIVKSFRIEGL